MCVAKVTLVGLCLVMVGLCAANMPYPPVILVPGDGASQIQAKYDHVQEPHIFCCSESGSFFNIWLSVHMFFPYLIDCLAHNLGLHYNPSTRTTSDTPGVTTRIQGWGDTSTVDWLDTVHLPPTNYYNDISNALVNIGYERGVSLRAAPYDFRKAPNEMRDYFTQFKSLIEDTYALNNNKTVIVIAHSMGNLVTLYFFNHMTQAWKDKYIRGFVTLAAPWAGSMKVVKMIVSGFNFNLPGVSSLSLRPVQRSFPSTAWLMPSPTFWGHDEVILRTPNRTYTVNDYEEFFRAIDFPTGWEMRKDTRDLLGKLDAPNVPVHCLYGTKVDTYRELQYTDTTWPNGNPAYTTDDGDGSVNIRSLRACLSWQRTQSQPVNHMEFPGVNHLKMLHNEGVTSYIISVVRLGAEKKSNATNRVRHFLKPGEHFTSLGLTNPELFSANGKSMATCNSSKFNVVIFFLFLYVSFIFRA